MCVNTFSVAWSQGLNSALIKLCGKIPFYFFFFLKQLDGFAMCLFYANAERASHTVGTYGTR